MAFGKKVRPTVDKDGAALVMRKRDYLADFSGQLGLGLMANLVGQLQYFYTDKVGIAVGSVGVVMAIAKVVDALTDIWFGNIIDHSKGGNMKYYKWMLRMAVPAAVITVMMFTVPIQAGQIPAVAYALVTNLLITAVIYTMIATPFAATMIVRTRSQQERGNMGILRAVGNYASGMVIAKSRPFLPASSRPIRSSIWPFSIRSTARYVFFTISLNLYIRCCITS